MSIAQNNATYHTIAGKFHRTVFYYSLCMYVYALIVQALVQVVTWEALDSSSKTTVVGVGEEAEVVGVVMEEAEEIKQLASQMGGCFVCY